MLCVCVVLLCVVSPMVCRVYVLFFFFKQKTAYEMRISDWSSDVCSSDLVIASAKGLSEFAKQEQVVILRTVDNQRMAGLYDISAIRLGAYADPPVYANDVVIIGDSPQRRLFRDVVSLAPLLAAPLVAVLR